MLTVRIGTWLITAHGIALASAACLFVGLAFRDTMKEPWSSVRCAFVIVGSSTVIAAIGAVLYGLPETLKTAGSDEGLYLLRQMSFGSFGGTWGVLGGAALGAWIVRCPVLCAVNTMVPAMFLASAVARSSGITDLHWGGVWTGDVTFSLWSALDLFALGAIWILVITRRPGIPGQALTTFLILYGLARFSLEFIRPNESRIWLLTWGQILSVLQIGFGVLLRHRIKLAAHSACMESDSWFAKETALTKRRL